MAEETIVRENLMTRPGYTGYCGAERCQYRWPRTTYQPKLEQFTCSCGWVSQFPEDFIERYKTKWNLNKTT